MDDFIIEFGENEQQRLSKIMRPKKITLAEDETFHPQTCLVSIEPDSNYIIAEKYKENRKGETWTKLIQGSLEGLPVEVFQITSDIDYENAQKNQKTVQITKAGIGAIYHPFNKKPTKI